VDTWQMITTERESLADALAGLPEADWKKPSLCSNWKVRDVVAHLISTATLTPTAFFAKLLASGFNFQAMTAREIARIGSGASQADLVAALQARVGARTAPPGPAASWLGETIVHGEDIFRALSGYRPHPAENLIAVADFYKTSNLLIGSKRRIAGVRLRATDTDWTHGDGPEAAGRMVALVLAMTGRKAGLNDLSGEGADQLRRRG
jgi:uncharacterized protein (TIGR03083 family)